MFIGDSHSKLRAEDAIEQKFRRGCRNFDHDENCFFVQRRITYLLIRWKCSDSRSEAAWPLAHKNVRIANNPWNSFHPGLHCFQIPSLSDFSASFTLVTADYGSTQLAIQLIPEETRSLQWCHKTVLENLIKLRFSKSLSIRISTHEILSVPIGLSADCFRCGVTASANARSPWRGLIADKQRALQAIIAMCLS